MQNVYTLRLNKEEVELLDKAAKKNFNPDKHRKNYGIGSFLKESAIARAKRILK